MIRLKVVFQGGGAKLISLLAAAEILIELEQNRQIEVVRVAGVSAGAIAAAMLAAGINSTIFRETLRREGQDMIGSFPAAMSRPRLYWRIARGKPIYPEKSLRQLLNALFVDAEPKIERLRDLKKHLIVTASNLRNSEKVVYNSARNPDQHLVDALIDSCALPFAFRTYLDNQLVVDGGLSSNLPVDDILAEDPLLPTLAVGFEPQAQHEIQSAAGYGLALLGTAIDSATSVAVSRVKAIGGEAALLPHSFGTFEFERALSEGLSKEGYKELKARIREVMALPLAALQSQSGALASFADTDTITRVHRDLMKSFPYSIGKCSTTVYANCLATGGKSLYPEDDVSLDVVEYTADSDLLVGVKMGLAVNGYYKPIIDRDSCRLELEDRSSVEAEQVIVSEVKQFADGLGTVYSSLFFLKEPLRGAGALLRVVQPLRQKNCMIDLKLRGWDWMRAYSSKHPWPLYDHLILCPGSFGPVDLSDLYPHLSKIPEDETFNRRIAPTAWVKGRVMTKQEIGEHFPVPAPGYAIYGWRTTNIPIGGFCGCHIAARN
jgi:predicted acylesterase/phospholipase RssA